MNPSSDRSLPEYRSALAPFILNFVLEKRATGCRYDKNAQMLKRFDRFCAEHGLGSDGLTKETAMLWAEKTKVDPVVKTKNHCIFNSSEKEFRLFNGNLSGFSTGVDIPGCPVVQ